MSEVAMNMDANFLADALGISPQYKRDENRRWSSALKSYKDLLMEGGVEEASNTNTEQPPFSPTNPYPINYSPAPASLLLNSDSQTPSFGIMSPHRFSVGGGITPPVRSLGLHGGNSLGGGFHGGRGSLPGSNVSPGEGGHSSLELEAVAAVHELSFAVKAITVSDMLPRTPQLIFVNVTTLEGQAYCLELTSKGWRVTSLRHDCMNGDIHNIDLHTRYFESAYSLMDHISVGYREKFSQALTEKLNQLQTATPPLMSPPGTANSDSFLLQKHPKPVTSVQSRESQTTQTDSSDISDIVPVVQSSVSRTSATHNSINSDSNHLSTAESIRVVKVRNPSGEGKRQTFPHP